MNFWFVKIVSCVLGGLALLYVAYCIARKLKLQALDILRARVFDNPKIHLFGESLRRGPTCEPVVALTFDDGPIAPYTEQVLDTLSALSVRATFFLVGRNIERYPELAQRIVREGHQVGNHSYSHFELVSKSLSVIRDEIDRTDALIRALGYSGEIAFRAPYARKFLRLPWVLKEKQKLHVLFEAFPRPRDWWGASSHDVAQNVLDVAGPGEIIVLHDGNHRAGPNVAATTSLIVKGLKARGFRFATVEQMLSSVGVRVMQYPLGADETEQQRERRVTSLRWDSIRAEIQTALPESLLFGPNVVDRAVEGRALLLNEDCVRVLLPNSETFTQTQRALSKHGFSRIGYSRACTARWKEYPEVAIFRRHDFVLSVSTRLPVLFANRWPVSGDFAEPCLLSLATQEIHTIRPESELVFRMLRVFDRLVFSLPDQDAVLHVYALLLSESSRIDWDRCIEQLKYVELYELMLKLGGYIRGQVEEFEELPPLKLFPKVGASQQFSRPASLPQRLMFYLHAARPSEWLQSERVLRRAPVDFCLAAVKVPPTDLS